MIRLFNILSLLCLLGLFGWLLGYVDNRQVFLTSQPVSTDRNQHGLHKLKSLSQQAGYTTVSLTTGYRQLTSPTNTDKLPGLLFIALPSSVPASQHELTQLQDWVKSGNTIVVMLALDDKPHWHNQQSRFTIDNFLYNFDLSLIELNQQPTEPDQNKQGILISQLPNQLTAGIKQVESHSDQLTHTWQLSGKETVNSSLILLRDQTSLSPVAWLTRYGKGRLFIFTHSDLFSNTQLTRADNLVLAKNILYHSLSASGAIYFDDIHHIITPPPSAYFSLVHPLILLFAGMVIFMLISKWLQQRQPHRKQQALTLQQFIRNISIQEARTFSDSEIALRYAALFFDKVRARHGLTRTDQPAWDLLKADNKNVRLLAGLEKTYQRALAAKRINLYKFIERLEKLRI